MEALYNDLNTLCRRLNFKYSINSGGCCFVAYCIAKELEARKIPFKVVIFAHLESEFGTTSKLELRKLIKSRDCEFAENSFSHYCIQVESGRLNADDFDNYAQITLGCIKASDLEFLYNYGDWNSCYDIDHNKLVKSKIHKLFNDYFTRGSKH